MLRRAGHSLRPMHRAVLRTGRNRIADGLWSRVPAGGCLADRGRCGRCSLRYGGRSSKVPLCGLSPEGTGRGGVRGLFLHRMRGRIEIRRETIAQRRPADRGLGCQFGRGCRRDAGLWRRFHRDRRPERLAVDDFLSDRASVPAVLLPVSKSLLFADRTGNAGRKGLFWDKSPVTRFLLGNKKLQRIVLQLFSYFGGISGCRVF